MSAKIKKHFPKLQLLHSAPPKVKKEILEDSGDEITCCICECTLNILRGVVPLTEKQKKRLIKYKKRMRELVSSQTTDRKKRKIIQSGGFLGALLAPVLGFLGSLLTPKS